MRMTMASASGPTTTAAASCRLRKVGGNFITFEPDFGKSIVHNFHFETNLVNGIDEPEVVEQGTVQVYPEPDPGM